jgi:hypothetical protein
VREFVRSIFNSSELRRESCESVHEY